MLITPPPVGQIVHYYPCSDDPCTLYRHLGYPLAAIVVDGVDTAPNLFILGTDGNHITKLSVQYFDALKPSKESGNFWQFIGEEEVTESLNKMK